MGTLMAVLVVIFVALMSTAWISGLVSVARMPQTTWNVAHRRKGVTFFLVLMTGGFGGIYYWGARLRPDLLAERQLPTDGDAPPLTKAQRRAAEAYQTRN